MTKPAPHEYLAARPHSCVEDLDVGAFALNITYALGLPDGEVRRFRLHIKTRAEVRVSVREVDTSRALPAGCPERHINYDGTFCLGMVDDEPDLTMAAGVDRWWARLAGFLKLQILAEATGKWPKENAWRHGDAAVAQRELELLVADRPWLADVPVAVFANGRVADRRARCPCASGRATLHCHETDLVKAGRLRRQIEERETNYYREWESPCCRTMLSCGVRRHAKRRG